MEIATGNPTSTADRGEGEIDELVALARMIMFARNSAQDLQSEVGVYCLNLALHAILQEIGGEVADELGNSIKQSVHKH